VKGEWLSDEATPHPNPLSSKGRGNFYSYQPQLTPTLTKVLRRYLSLSICVLSSKIFVGPHCLPTLQKMFKKNLDAQNAGCN
jgi:hypothetical protein